MDDLARCVAGRWEVTAVNIYFVAVSALTMTTFSFSQA